MPIHSIVLGYGCRFNEFGADGGPAAKALQPKFNVFVKNISAHLGVAVPHIEVRICFFSPHDMICGKFCGSLIDVAYIIPFGLSS